MRILIVSTHDSRGGAANAAYRFSKEFIKQGHEVCFYVRDKKKEDSFIKQSNTPKWIAKILHFVDFLPGFILSGFNRDVNFTLGLFGESLNPIIKEFKPDIINIHWTWKGFVSFPEICRVSRKIPVVWTMHDYSPFSGGKFYPEQGEKKLIKLVAKINVVLRRIFCKRANIEFVSPSEFLAKEFQKVSFSHNQNIAVINNGVDTGIFKKLNKINARTELGLKNGKKYILFGAVNILENKIKGGRFLKSLFKDIEDYLLTKNIGLVSFGSQNPFPQFNLVNSIEQIFLGYVKDERKMVKILSSSDIMLVPSFFENYPFVVMESLACSVPVVAFNTGGIPEMIEHKKNGFLAKFDSSDSFKEGIVYCLEEKLDNQRDFSIEKKAKNYIELFNNCLHTNR